MNLEHLVAVYGSLKRGYFNHDLLHGAEFVGEDWLFDFSLYDLGPFPAVISHPSEGVLVEVYRITTHQLHRLDQLEGFDSVEPQKSFYLRVEVGSSYGPVWVYEYNRKVEHHQQIKSGNWGSV